MTRQRRSLSNVGGPCERRGDSERARDLAYCIEVRPLEKPPFTHGFHAYPARMHPETARRALERFAPRAVLDPFVGSGTTALEAGRAGLPFTGIDVSRVAIEIAWARTRIWVPADCRRVEIEGARIAAAARQERRPLPAWAEKQKDWYSPHTLEEVAALKGLIDEVDAPDVRRILTVVLSSLLVKLSKQASDSVAAPDREYKPWPPGTAYRLFRDKCSELTRNLLLLSSDLYKRKVKAIEPDLRLADARTVALPPGSFDLILTSPPYPGTYDYAMHHQLRLPLYGEDARFAAAYEIGARRGFNARRYRDDLLTCLKNFLPALAPKGRMLFLIGDSQDIRTDRLLRELAEEAGARVTATASQNRIDWTSEGRMRRKREHFVMIENPL